MWHHAPQFDMGHRIDNGQWAFNFGKASNTDEMQCPCRIQTKQVENEQLIIKADEIRAVCHDQSTVADNKCAALILNDHMPIRDEKGIVRFQSVTSITSLT